MTPGAQCHPDEVGDRQLRSLAVIADAHLAGEDPEGLEEFRRLVASLPGRVEGLVLLGDLFEVWAALPHLMAGYQREALGWLEEAAARGLRLFYVEGNRDYAVRALEGSPFEVVGRSLGLRVAGRGVWLCHGDLVNPADLPYRLWCAVTRSGPARLFLHALPARFGRRLIFGLAERLRATNVAHKTRFPEAAARDYLRRHAGRGYDLVVLGHFHREWTLRREAAFLWSLPAWLEGGQWLEVNEAGARLQGPIGGSSGRAPALSGPGDGTGPGGSSESSRTPPGGS